MATLLMWLFAGLVNVVVSYSYVELCLTLERAGSDYLFIKEGMGDMVAVAIMWMLVFVRLGDSSKFFYFSSVSCFSM